MLKMLCYRPERFGRTVKYVQDVSKLSSYQFESGVYSVSVNNALSLDWYFEKRGVEGFFLVCFGGAVSNRKGSQAPFFSGIELSRELNVTLLSFSDTTLALAPDLPLGWYAGNQDMIDSPARIAAIIESYAGQLGATPILLGGSCGGFAVLVQQELLNIKSLGFVWNPQTSITEYNIDFVYQYIAVAFPSRFKEVALAEGLSPKEKRKIAYDILTAEGVIHDLTSPLTPRRESGETLYLQNKSDWHMHSHMLPYVTRRGWVEKEEGVFVDQKSKQLVVAIDWGVGHVPPSREVIILALECLINGAGISECLERVTERIGGAAKQVARLNAESNIRFSASYWVDEERKEVVCVVNQSPGWSGHAGEKYAFYLIVDGVRKDVCWYQSSLVCVFDLPKGICGTLSVQAFMLDAFGEKHIVAASRGSAPVG